MDRDEESRKKSEYAAWSDRIERVLARGIMVLAILLCLFQLALQFPLARHLLTTTDDSEGVPFHYVAR
ncbi:hypothetical protein [Cohnella silvisoli]|uniref:Uncharacterized protein n=1 Tax=Cohnella silvisoli TaxID=2873699 RepID=A0ABV1KSA6_9BACL|nr:hypothetical protein [Cohnella silvisoli]MCD9021231.1 hypothetical protein [Cohnella silvisoli]